MEGRVVELRGAEKNGERRRDGEVTIITIDIIIVLMMMTRLGGTGRGRGRTQLVGREPFLQVDHPCDQDHDVDNYHLLSVEHTWGKRWRWPPSKATSAQYICELKLY